MSDADLDSGDGIPSSGPSDDVRDRLVDAAAEVFARDGYEGARIQDIVRTAGLTTGAVYGRFRGKAELIHEAVVTRAVPREPLTTERRVSELVEAAASHVSGELSRRDALLLETYVAARREPEVANAIADANERWVAATAPLVEAALVDGTIDDGIDPDAVLYLVRVLRLGSLLQRGAGLPSPAPDAWEKLIHRVVASFGRPDGASTDTEGAAPDRTRRDDPTDDPTAPPTTDTIQTSA